MAKFERKSKIHSKIAEDHIRELFIEAGKVCGSDKNKANRYVELALKTSMKNKVPIPTEFKRKYCKKCHVYLGSENLRVRTNDGKIVYFCKDCKSHMRIPIKN